MSNNIIDDLKDAFHILLHRIEHAPEVGYIALKGFTWDLFIKGKTTSQVAKDVEAHATAFEEAAKRTKPSSRYA